LRSRPVVAHARRAFVLDAAGQVTRVMTAAAGSTLTNVAFRPGTSALVITDSGTGAILEAELPGCGIPLFSHA
jgi:gluconolactonase